MLGAADRNLKMIREALGVHITAREGAVRLSGDRHAVSAARRVLDQLAAASRGDGEGLSRQRVLDLIGRAAGEEARHAGHHDDAATGRMWDDRLDVYAGGIPVASKTPNQQLYLDAIRDHDVIFGLGPAGTGKTYLAVAAAVHMLKHDLVKRVVLVRPAVEAGERLGFLPGDLQAKVNPYLRPLFDAMADMMDYATVKRFLLNDIVEVAPLAYMRGRTLNRSVIILDEAQNTTRTQMKMFLTRMGQGSKAIVTGDLTQTDLSDPTQSGLIDAVRRLGRVKGIAFVTLTERDIVRHDIVQRIVEAYDPVERVRSRPAMDPVNGSDPPPTAEI
ncbi:MAG: PhoH family protein [Phycisphaerae bacterium]|nr:PhoH family protein [Phycisphaerae bacterium]